MDEADVMHPGWLHGLAVAFALHPPLRCRHVARVLLVTNARAGGRGAAVYHASCPRRLNAIASWRAGRRDGSRSRTAVA